MKERRKKLFQSRQVIIAGCMMLVLVTCLTGVLFTQNMEKQQNELQLAGNDEEMQSYVQEETIDRIADRMLEDEPEKNMDDVTEEASITVTKKNEHEKEEETDVKVEETEKKEAADTVGTAAIQSKPQVNDLHFDNNLLWPTKGSVLMDYSMDQSIYFQSLNQYKYNPAMIIQADEGNSVVAAAAGTVVKVENDATTGTTLTMDIGDGYQLVYGQLKDLVFSEGAHVDAGDVIGCISAPTKYYSEEGSNLYFAMQKENKPVNPSDFLTD